MLAGGIAGQINGLGRETELGAQVRDNPSRDGGEILKEGAHIAGGGQLQGHPEPVARATMGQDERSIGIVEMEEAGQFCRGRLAGVAAIPVFLLGCQEINGHGRYPPHRPRRMVLE